MSSVTSKSLLSTTNKSIISQEPNYLSLCFGTPKPFMNFGSIQLGDSTQQNLVVSNPHRLRQELHIDSLPTKDGISVKDVIIYVAPRSDVLVQIDWTPYVAGDLNSAILFRWSTQKIKCLLFGTAIESGHQNQTVNSSMRETYHVDMKIVAPNPRELIRSEPIQSSVQKKPTLNRIPLIQRPVLSRISSEPVFEEKPTISSVKQVISMDPVPQVPIRELRNEILHVETLFPNIESSWPQNIISKCEKTCLLLRWLQIIAKLMGTTISSFCVDPDPLLSKIECNPYQIDIKKQKLYDFPLREGMEKNNIQMFAQAFNLMIKVRKHQIHSKSIVIIQNVLRGYNIRNKISQKMNKIQILNNFMEGCVIRQRMEKKMKSICLIQDVFRGCMVRKLLGQKLQGLIVIQGASRGFLLRRHHEKCGKAIDVIQSVLLGLKERIKMKSMAITCVQSFMRACLERQKIGKKIESCGVILSALQGYQARYQLAVKFEGLNVLCSFFRGISVHNKMKRMLDGGNVILAALQGHPIRQNVQEMKNSAQIITSALKGYPVRKLLYQTLKHVVTIQSSLRASLERRRCDKKMANTKILQNCARGYLIRREIELKNRCITTIQSFLRGSAIRSDFISKSKRIVTISSFLRGTRERRHATQALDAGKCILSSLISWKFQNTIGKMHKSAQAIQSALRGNQARRICVQQRNQQKWDAAVLIQSSFQGIARRRQIEHIMTSARIIETALVGNKIRQDLEDKKQAILIISNALMGFAARSALSDRLKQLCTIQSAMRGCLERRRRNKRWNSIELIQARCTGYLVQKRHEKLVKNVLMIQKHAKYHLVQKQLAQLKVERLLFVRQSFEIVKLQALFRGHFYRRSHRDVMKQIQVCYEKGRENVRIKRELDLKSKASIKIILTSDKLSLLMQACADLEYTTRYSQDSCDSLLREGAMPALLSVIPLLNRSPPHLEVVKHILSILIHLKADVIQGGSSLCNVIVEQMMNNKDKPELFLREIRILKYFDDLPVDRLKQVLLSMSGKYKLEKKFLLLNQVKLKGSKTDDKKMNTSFDSSIKGRIKSGTLYLEMYESLNKLIEK